MIARWSMFIVCALLHFVTCEFHPKLANGNGDIRILKHSPSLSIDKVPDQNLDGGDVHAYIPTILPNPDSGNGQHDKTQDGEETVDINMETKPNGIVSMKFKSHGRQHQLELTESRMRFEDISIKLLGASDEYEQRITEEMKGTKMMKDNKYGAIIAIEGQDGNSSSTVKAGVFLVGKHEFAIRSDGQAGSGKAKVSRQHISDSTNRKRDHLTPKGLKRQKRSTPAALTPLSVTVELVMILDYSIWNRTQMGSVTAENETDHMVSMLLYYAHMAQIMDDYYQTMKNDDINIFVDLAGIVVLTTPSTLPDLVEAHAVNNTYIDSESTLTRLTEWLNTTEAADVLPPHDHTMLFTAYDMYEQSDLSTETVGLAWTGTICDPQYSSSLIEVGELLTFDASTAAHELGHSLGALHDGDDSSFGCEDKNYLMAAFAGNPDYLNNRFLFSCCSQRSFYATIHESGWCLSNTTAIPNYNSSIDENVLSYMPGQIFPADDQCYINMGTAACNSSIYGALNTSICLNLWCVSADDPNYCRTAYTAAADGTECDLDKWCSFGECVDIGDITSTLDQHCNVNDCYSSEKRCTNGTNKYITEMLYCYYEDFQCDCYSDCTDKSDESGCEAYCTCPPGFSKCNDGASIYGLPQGVPQYCVFNSWVCDGAEDCSDGSDELDCIDSTASSTTTTPATTSYDADNRSSTTTTTATSSSGVTSTTGSTTSITTSSTTTTTATYTTSDGVTHTTTGTTSRPTTTTTTTTNGAPDNTATTTKGSKDCYSCSNSNACVTTSSECESLCPQDPNCQDKILVRDSKAATLALDCLLVVITLIANHLLM